MAAIAKKIKVERIEIKIGDKSISLTPEEMKELRDIIDQTFPKEVVYVPGRPIIIEKPIYPPPIDPWPWKRWNKPIWIARERTWSLCSNGS